jgi:hypothetical protein
MQEDGSPVVNDVELAALALFGAEADSKDKGAGDERCLMSTGLASKGLARSQFGRPGSESFSVPPTLAYHKAVREGKGATRHFI